MWDAFAVSTYLTISALFWTMGLIPDVANAREVATGWRKKLYTVLAHGMAGHAIASGGTYSMATC